MTYLAHAAVAAVFVLLQPITLPDTPQGRAVLEYIDAFNRGTEADVMKVLEKYGSPAALQRRTPEQRREAYQGVKKTFGTLEITRVVSSSPHEIVVAMTRLDGTETWWTFAFEPGEKVQFAGISLKTPTP
jgi:hypothetical protein